MRIFPIVYSVSLATMATILIKNAESFRQDVYQDDLGHLTIGWGFTFLDFPEAERTKLWNNGITMDRAEEYLSQLVTSIMQDIDRNFSNLDRNVKLTFIDMIYNLGFEQFITFTTFLKFVYHSEIAEAVNDLTNTLWYRQVKLRAIRDCFNLLASHNYYLI